jgi:DNA polymerase III subunit delta'
MEKIVFPWIEPVLERLPRAPRSMPHAVLLSGQVGLGKRSAALYLAQSILCETARVGVQACGHCVACNLFRAGTHPDMRFVEIGQEEDQEAAGPDEETTPGQKKPSRHISVDRIRQLNDFVVSTAFRGWAKVILIAPAEAMHPSASNALLKILEEPPQGTHFLLVTHRPDRLLPTLRSRCFQVGFPVPPAGVAMQWLEQQGLKQPGLALAQGSYAPVAALELGKDAAFWAQRKLLLDALAEPRFEPLGAAESAETLEGPVVAGLLLQWAYDLMCLKSGTKLRYHLDYRKALMRLAESVEPPAIVAWYDAVLQYSRFSQHPLNKRLAIESLFSGYPACSAENGRLG